MEVVSNKSISPLPQTHIEKEEQVEKEEQENAIKNHNISSIALKNIATTIGKLGFGEQLVIKKTKPRSYIKATYDLKATYQHGLADNSYVGILLRAIAHLLGAKPENQNMFVVSDYIIKFLRKHSKTISNLEVTDDVKIKLRQDREQLVKIKQKLEKDNIIRKIWKFIFGENEFKRALITELDNQISYIDDIFKDNEKKEEATKSEIDEIKKEYEAKQAKISQDFEKQQLEARENLKSRKERLLEKSTQTSKTS